MATNASTQPLALCQPEPKKSHKSTKKELSETLARIIKNASRELAPFKDLLERFPSASHLRTISSDLDYYANIDTDALIKICGLTSCGFNFQKFSPILSQCLSATCAVISFSGIYASFDISTSIIQNDYAEFGPIIEIIPQHARTRYFFYVNGEAAHSACKKYLKEDAALCNQLGTTDCVDIISIEPHDGSGNYEVQISFEQYAFSMNMPEMEARLHIVFPEEILKTIIFPEMRVKWDDWTYYYSHPVSGDNFVNYGIKIKK